MAAPDLQIELRTALPGEAAAIHTLTRQAYARWVPILGREPKPMGADYEAAVPTHRLMAHAEEIARARGRVRLYINQRFAENVRLYLRQGYVLEGKEDLGARTVRVAMSKALA